MPKHRVSPLSQIHRKNSPPSIVLVVRTVSAIAFIVELAVVPSIIITVTIATVITTAAEDAVGRFILPFLSQVIKNGCANQYIKESHNR